MKTTPARLLGLTLTALALVMSSCNMPASSAGLTPTMNITQAYETVAANLTQAAALTPPAPPSPTPAPTDTPAATPTAATPSPIPSATQAAPANTCDLAAPGTPIDVTIPDDTQMQPGQAFTKVWRLKNAGTCTWTKAYTIAVFSGEAMSAPQSVALPKEVPPGQEVDIAVDLVAPITPGTHQGNWKLRNASGAWFGIGPSGGSPFWVKIIVGGTITGAPPTPAATTTGGPPVQANGVKVLAPNDFLNLDNNQINSGAGDDLSYQIIDNQALVIPFNGATFGLWSSSQPTRNDCLGASYSNAALTIETIGPNRYVCVQTNLGLIGWFVLTAFNTTDKTLTLQFLTWAQP